VAIGNIFPDRVVRFQHRFVAGGVTDDVELAGPGELRVGRVGLELRGRAMMDGCNCRGT
jgi:hypothetical protein